MNVSPPHLAYPDWKAPSEDGALLIWPEPSEIISTTLQNQRRLAASESVRVQNIPLPELRQRARQWIGQKENDRPIIGTGHQTELYHAGVWVKDALIGAAARKLDGSAYHFAVDTDSPKHLMLR